MARLVIVSNRVPLPSERGPRAGGLAVALADALRPGTLWFGWSGRRSGAADGRGAAAARGGHDLRHDRSDRSGIPLVLRQLRQRRAVAAAALPPRPGGVPARGLRRLPRGQPAVRRGTGPAAARGRPDLGARLPPVPAGRGTAPARRAQPHRLLPAHAVRAAGAAARPAARRRAAAGHVRLRRRGLPHAHLPARLPRLRAGDPARHAGSATAPSSTKAAAFMRLSIRSASTPTASPRPPRAPNAAPKRHGCARAWAAARWPSASTGSTTPRAWSTASRHSAGCSASIPSIDGRSASCRSPRGRARNPAATSGCGASSIASSATPTAGSPSSTGCRCAT